MARLNIEEEFWTEVMSLAVSLGDVDKAIGNVIRFWRFAQSKHKQNQIISELEFKEQGFSEKLFPLFATRIEHGVIARGAHKHFGWLRDRVNAGKKGGSSKPKQTKPKPSKVKQPEASYSSSFSPSDSTSDSSIFTAGQKLPSDNQKTLGSICFDAYSEAYKKRYGQDPTRDKTVNSIFKRLADRLGAEAPDVARFYLSHSDFAYVKSAHSVEILLKHAAKLRLEWASGQKITNSSARNAETAEHYREQMDMVQRGEI